MRLSYRMHFFWAVVKTIPLSGNIGFGVSVWALAGALHSVAWLSNALWHKVRFRCRYWHAMGPESQVLDSPAVVPDIHVHSNLALVMLFH